MSDQDAPPIVPQQPSKSELIRQISAALLERRTSRSLTLEKVSQAIKIRQPYLAALEKGEWNELPGEVFVRGFIRRYAQYMGLDGDKLIAPYVNISESPVEKKPSPSTVPERHGEFGKTQLLWGFLGVIFIIGFLKVIKQDHKTPSKPASASQAPAPRSLGEGGAAPVEAMKSEEPKPVLAKHQIEVYSPYPLWLRVNAAEKSFEGFIPQSSTWTWKGEGEFTVRLGHTKEVNLIFDGKLIALGEDQKKIVLPVQ